MFFIAYQRYNCLKIVDRIFFGKVSASFLKNSSIGDKRLSMTQIHEQLKAMRKERGLTQKDLALQSGLSFSFINEMEKGKPTIRLDALSKLAAVFGYELTLTKISASSDPDADPAQAGGRL